MKPKTTRPTEKAEIDDLESHYDFDYSKAKPNICATPKGSDDRAVGERHHKGVSNARRGKECTAPTDRSDASIARVGALFVNTGSRST